MQTQGVAALCPGLLSVAPTGLKRAAVRGSGREKSAKSLASQARHETDAPKELFAGAKRGRESSRKFGLFHKGPRSFTKVRTDQARKSAIVRIVTGGSFFLWKG